MISVLLPYRDAEATLAEALAGVLAEPEVDEVIAIDDGSRDASAGVARAPGDSRVVHLTTESVGIARALAAGLERARGELVGRMDADDVSLPGRFAAQRAMLEADPGLGVVGCRVRGLGPAEGLARYLAWQNALLTPQDHARDVFVESPLCHPSVLMRRAALEAAGGYRDTPWPEDYDLWLRMHARGVGMAKVDRELFAWRQRDGRATFADPRCAPERLLEARARYLAAWLGRTTRPLWVWGAGQTGKRLARALEPEGVHAAAFVDIDPDKLGRTARGAPVLAPEAIRPGAATIVVAVGAPGAREAVRAWMREHHLVEGADFVCAA